MYHTPVRAGLVIRLRARVFCVLSLSRNAARTLGAGLALSLGLGVGTVLPTHAQLPLSQAPPAAPCEATGSAAGTHGGQALVATVTRVDPGQGQLEFSTATGSFLLTTTAEMHDLQVGDQLLFCLHAEGSEGAARGAEEEAAAPSHREERLGPRADPLPAQQPTPPAGEQGAPRHE
jgi:hypothetical protein